MAHDGLMTVMYASDQPPSWAVIDWGNNPEPEARIVGMFYNQAEAYQYSHWRRKHLQTIDHDKGLERGTDMGLNEYVSGPQGSAVPLTAEQKLAKIEWLANSWFEGYDETPANDPRSPSEADLAYDDAAFQILHILGKV